MPELPPKSRFEHANTPELGQRSSENAVLEFAENRARRLLEATYIQGTLEEVGLEDMRENASLLENLPREVEMRESEPLCTVCVPVALLSEDPEMICRTVEMIGSSEIPEGGNVELILWANAKYHGGNEDVVRREAAEKYQALRDSLMELDAPGVKIKTALQIFPKKDFSMSRLRRNYMDAIAVTVLDEERDFDYPVVWLDADTTQLSDRTLFTLSREVRNREALFVHANLRYNLDWTGKPFTELDDAEKAVAVNEIHRRQAEREMGDQPLGYIEESGLAFSIGTYLEVGGVRTSDPINESADMVLSDTARDLLKLDKTIPTLIKYERSAHVGLSARRHYEVAQARGVNGLDAALWREIV